MESKSLRSINARPDKWLQAKRGAYSLTLAKKWKTAFNRVAKGCWAKLVRHHKTSEIMRTFISSGWFSLFFIVACGSLSIAAETLPSDAVIQQRMVGTWHLNWMVLHETITIGTNGDYAALQTSAPSWTNTNRLEGTIKIKDGLMIDTVKKSSTTNEPMPLISTNVIIRLTDDQWLYRAQDRSQQLYLWERSMH
jgi:hypothetical protein